jgi:hypothetical protein
MSRDDPLTPPSDPSAWTLPRLGINQDGAWLHEGEEVTHPGILDNLRSSLRVDRQGHYVQVGTARVPVEVEAAPYVVVRVEQEGERLILTLNELTREPLRVDTLRLGRDAVPYCRVKEGRFDARLSRAAAYQLLQHVQYDETSHEAWLVLGGARHALPDLRLEGGLGPGIGEPPENAR